MKKPQPEPPAPVQPHQKRRPRKLPPAAIPAHNQPGLDLPLNPNPLTKDLPMHSQGQAGQPGANVQEKGKNIYDLRSNVAVQKNVPPQRHFGSFIHASYSFGLATYCCNATHGKAFQETDEIHGGCVFSPPHLFPSPSMDTIYDQDLNEGENVNFDANTDAVQKFLALGAHGKPSAAPNAVAPAGTSPDVAAAAPASTPTDISTRNQLTGLDVVAIASEQAPLGFVNNEKLN